MKKLFIPLAFLLLLSNAYSQREGDWSILNPPNSPDARHGHSMVTLPDGRVMMFGGEGIGQSWFNDLHAFEDANWSEITPNNTPPSPRRDHSAWMEGDQMYIYGGTDQNGPLNDMWYYDLTDNNWYEQVLTGTIPPGRSGHSTTRVSDGSVLILGGVDSNGDPLNDFYKMQPNHNFEQLADAPRYYSYHIPVLIDDDFLLVFGEPYLIGLYQLSVGVWGETPSVVPFGGRGCSTRAIDEAYDEVMSLYGGWDANQLAANTVSEFNLITGEYTIRIEPLPGTLVGGAAAKFYNYNKTGDDFRVLIFGGIVDGVVSNQTWMSTSNLVGVSDNNKYDESTIEIYPNPSAGHIEISCNVDYQNVEVLNNLGSLIMEIECDQKYTSLDLSSFNNGVYFLKVYQNQRIFTRKIILNK